MLKKIRRIGIALLVFSATVFTAYAETSQQSLESFAGEFQWLDIKKCQRPPLKPPPPILIRPPAVSELNSRKISVRRWLDEDGDGICELYDLQKLEESYFTGKLYGYPYRAARFENGKWVIQNGSTGRWFPLILFDKVTGTRLNIFYSYGNAGYTEGGAGPRPDCESMRSTLAEGFMLLFHFPEFARQDPVMDPNGLWNDYISGWINSQYPEKEGLLASPVPSDCIRKYQLVIDAIAKKLGN